MLARQAVLASALEMTQNIYSAAVATPGNSANVVNVIPRNVGLVKRFTVELTATITNTSTSTLTATNFNAAQLLSQVVFNDLNNNTRIQTAGWHINAINTARARRVFGSALTQDSPIKYGSNLGGSMFAAPATIGPTTTGVVVMMYEIPLAYDDHDLRGALYCNVVNATMLLQLSLNPTPVVAAASDATLAVYSGGTGSFTSVVVNVYQTFLDQLPMGKQGPILPIQDLSTIYELKNTSLTGMVANQDYPIPYSNFRDFLSTFIVFDNNGTLNGGTDINYFALQSANFTNIIKVDPFLLGLWTRKEIQDDFPKGLYYLSHRKKPLSTIQYGNLELIVNPSAVGAAAAQFLMGYEDFALVNTITGAGSLAAG